MKPLMVVSRLIPRVAPVNPKGSPSMRRAQDALESGMRDSLSALAAVPSLGLDDQQRAHIVRLVGLHLLYAFEDADLPASALCPALVDRLNRECWLLDGGAR